MQKIGGAKKSVMVNLKVAYCYCLLDRNQVATACSSSPFYFHNLRLRAALIVELRILKCRVVIESVRRLFQRGTYRYFCSNVQRLIERKRVFE